MTQDEIYFTELLYQFKIYLDKNNLGPSEFAIQSGLSTESITSVLNENFSDYVSLEKISSILGISKNKMNIPIMEECFGKFLDQLFELALNKGKLNYFFSYWKMRWFFHNQSEMIVRRNFAWYRYLVCCEFPSYDKEQMEGTNMLLINTKIKAMSCEKKESVIVATLEKQKRLKNIKNKIFSCSGSVISFTKSVTPEEYKKASQIVDNSKKRKK